MFTPGHCERRSCGGERELNWVKYVSRFIRVQCLLQGIVGVSAEGEREPNWVKQVSRCIRIQWFHRVLMVLFSGIIAYSRVLLMLCYDIYTIRETFCFL